MNCKNCETGLSKKQKSFCSIKCKSEWQAKQPKEIFDQTKQFKCLIDGKLFNIGSKRSGSLLRYSKNILNKSFDESDWEIVNKIVNEIPKWNCPHCDKSFKCNGIDAGGWIGNHLLKVHGFSKIDHVQKFPQDSVLWPNRLKKAERKLKIETSDKHRVECLECNQFFSKISNSHLRLKHGGMTMEQYKKKHPFARVNSQELSDKAREIYFGDNGLSKVSPESNGEKEIKEFVQSLGFETKKFKTGFSEIDVFVPEMNVGFEYHGIFHHSQFRGRHKKYRHSDNLQNAEERGIQLIQIFEDEWLCKKEIVKSRIRNILKVDSIRLQARKCEVRLLTISEIRDFLNQNHLQGYKYAKFNVGLIFEGEVVQCMTFIDINKRTNGSKIYPDGVYENVRSCTKIDYYVIGGFERMLKFFEDTVKPNQIVSFADRRWSSLLKEPFYIRLGFEFVKNTGNAFWVMKGYTKRMYRSNFTKPKMRAMNPELFKDFSDKELTQEKMLQMLGFDIIWDCGNLKFVKNYNQNLEIPIIDEVEEEIETDEFVFESRKRHLVENIPTDSEDYMQCQLCKDYYFRKGFSTHLGNEHKMKNFEYIAQFGEYRLSHLKSKK